MNEETKEFKEMYDRLMNYEQKLHEKNQKKIKIGIRVALIVPLIFLALLFISGSSKIVFLVLWIASLFGISIYLIAVEYSDYQLQVKIAEISGQKEKEVDSLVPIDELEEKVHERVQERVQGVREQIESVKEQIKKEEKTK